MVVGETVHNLITAAIGLLVLAGVIVGVSAFRTSQVRAGTACNSTSASASVCNAAWNLTTNVQTMTNQFGSQLGTVGIMFGVGLIIAAIAVLGVGMMRNT